MNTLKEQRNQNMEGLNSLAENEKIPNKTNKNYDVSIIYGPSSKLRVISIADMKSESIGSLIACKGIIVRMSEVKPRLIVGTYACDVCGCENYVEVMETYFTPLMKCNSQKCKSNNVNGKLTFLTGHSKFESYQELRIQ